MTSVGLLIINCCCQDQLTIQPFSGMSRKVCYRCTLKTVMWYIVDFCCNYFFVSGWIGWLQHGIYRRQTATVTLLIILPIAEFEIDSLLTLPFTFETLSWMGGMVSGLYKRCRRWLCVQCLSWIDCSEFCHCCFCSTRIENLFLFVQVLRCCLGNARPWNDVLCCVGHKLWMFTEHKGFVQGVAIDPLSQYLATLSDDRCSSLFIYIFI